MIPSLKFESALLADGRVMIRQTNPADPTCKLRKNKWEKAAFNEFLEAPSEPYIRFKNTFPADSTPKDHGSELQS